jgi:cobyrinic acid a,c-diamide synthase
MAELGYRSMDYIVVKIKQQFEENNNNIQFSKIGPNFLDATYLQLFATSFTLRRRLQNNHNNVASVQQQPNCE